MAAGLAYLGTWALFGMADHAGWQLPGWIDGEALNVFLVSVAALLAVGAAVLYIVRWHLVGETMSLRAGIGILVLAVGAYVTHDLVPAVSTALDGSSVGGLRGAAVVIGAALLFQAVREPPIDTAVTPARVAGRVVASFVVLSTALTLAPGTPSDWTGVSNVLPSADSSHPLMGAVSGLVWLGLASAYLLRGLRERRWLFTWLGLMLVGLSLSSAGSAVLTSPDRIWFTGAAVIELLAMAFAVYGGAHELAQAWRQQERALHLRRHDLLATEARRRAEIDRHEERAHDARSMLFAIQGAVYGLQETDIRLDDRQRRALAEALEKELERLRCFVDGPDHRATPVSFAVASIVEPVAMCHRSTDLGLAIDLDACLFARGRPADTAETLHSLLENARRHAPNSPVSVRATREEAAIVVRVEDRGPGVDPDEREAIFERGRRGRKAASDGSGLGLFVARRLMRAQGGDLRVETRAGGGAAFLLVLPAATEFDTSTPPLETLRQTAERSS